MKNNIPANFKLRFLASLTDDCISILIFSLCLYFISTQPTLSLALSSFLLFTILIFLNPIVLFNSIPFTHYLGGTPGKLLTGLKVTDESGKRLTFKRIMFRQTIGYSFSSLIFGLGFFSIAKDPKKQGWHDKAIGSTVSITQNLWPLALLTCIVTFSFSAYFAGLSYHSATTGPLAKESQTLWKQIEASTKQKAKTDKSKLIPTPSVSYPK